MLIMMSWLKRKKMALFNIVTLISKLSSENELSLNEFYFLHIILSMITEITKLVNGNRIVIPAAIRRSLGLRVGDAVTLVLQDNGELRLLTQTEAVRQAQALVRQHIAKDRSLVDELLTERRDETASAAGQE